MNNFFKTFLCLGFVAFALPTVAFASNDGDWTFVYTATKGGCGGAPGKVSVNGSKLGGYIVSADVGRLNITGSVKADGSFKGVMARGLGKFKGKISGNTGTGTFRDRFGCKGDFTIRKR